MTLKKYILENVIPKDLYTWVETTVKATQPLIPYSKNKIPDWLIKKTKILVNNKNGGIIYRGFGTYGDISNRPNVKMKYDTGSSWTYNKEIGIEFAESRIHEGLHGYIAEYNINKLKYVISVDIVLITGNSEYMNSEKEIIVLDEFVVSNFKLISKP